MSDDLEILRGPTLELKAGDAEGLIEGLCAHYGAVDAHDEVIAPFAFKTSIEATKAAGVRIPCLWQHAQSEPVGSWHSLVETAEGLHGKAQLDLNSPRAREAWSFIQGRHLSGLSVGFCRAERRGRTIVSAELKEISIVSVPAADKARLRLRDLGTVGELTDALMAGKLNRRDLELVARKSWPSLSGEEDPETLAALAERIARANAKLKGF